MSLNFSYRICAVIETREFDNLYCDEATAGTLYAVEQIYSALIWKNAGQYALISHFAIEEVLRVWEEFNKRPAENQGRDLPCIFWDDCIPIPNELAEELLWKRELEDKSNETDHGAKSDPE